MDTYHKASLFQPLELPCGMILKNRIAKSAMSDSLGDGRGDPTDAQIRLYERWAKGGLAVSIVGEVQGNPHFAEKPGNLVLWPASDVERFMALARAGSVNGAQLWLQLSHAGAMAHPPISDPKGPSALDIPGLTCSALTLKEVSDLPSEFARTAHMAKKLGFGGVQIHAAHGFLLSQFLSPLFNRRDDNYGGSVTNRMRLLLEVAHEVRTAVGPSFPIAVKLNATDQLEGGFHEDDALAVIAALDEIGHRCGIFLRQSCMRYSQTPAAQIGHGRATETMREFCREGCARHASHMGQPGDGPRLSDIGVKSCQCAPDAGVLESPQPTWSCRLGQLRVGPDCFDQQDVGKATAHNPMPHLLPLHLIRHQTQDCRNHVRSRVTGSNDHKIGQHVEKKFCCLFIERHAPSQSHHLIPAKMDVIVCTEKAVSVQCGEGRVTGHHVSCAPN